MTFPKSVQLDRFEVYEYALSGVCRCYDSIVTHSRKETHGSSRQGAWHRHIEGRIAEAALCKCFNRYSAGIGIIFGPDAGRITQVRQSDNPSACLVVHKSDPNHHWFWLVTGSFGSYTIHGFLRGLQCKLPHWFPGPHPKRPAFYVPQSSLLTNTKDVNWLQPL